MILSINVADEYVILVGRVIVGTKPKSRLLCMKSFVVVCLSAFKKSRLWSSPMMIPLGLSFFIAHSREL